MKIIYTLIGLSIGTMIGWILRNALPKHVCKFSEAIKVRHDGRWHYLMKCPECEECQIIDDSDLWKVDPATFKEEQL